MSWITVLGIAFGLAMDAFAVSLASGLKLARITPRHVFRLAFHFGLFQSLMPVIGWCIGTRIAGLAARFDHWIAFGLLSLIGGKMLCEATGEEDAEIRADPTRGMTLVALSLATSIDALAVGVSLALVQQSIWIPSLTTGVVTAGLTAVGIRFGNRLGRRWGRWAEVSGGGVLVLIGVRILLADLAANAAPLARF
ncbi:MAG: manganese efflux pump [Candidatus Anammoximicrobium sp.]|nr:manganese efflux pump [Candidatus Anammoximicrobium sp.]